MDFWSWGQRQGGRLDLVSRGDGLQLLHSLLVRSYVWMPWRNYRKDKSGGGDTTDVSGEINVPGAAINRRLGVDCRTKEKNSRVVLLRVHGVHMLSSASPCLRRSALCHRHGAEGAFRTNDRSWTWNELLVRYEEMKLSSGNIHWERLKERSER
jgi:hypothetical protein